jgi:hypothetical protein
MPAKHWRVARRIWSEINLASAPAREAEAQHFSHTDVDDMTEASALAALDHFLTLLAGAVSETRPVLAELPDASIVTASDDKTTLEKKMAGLMTGLLKIPAVKQRSEPTRLVTVVAGAVMRTTRFNVLARH